MDPVHISVRNNSTVVTDEEAQAMVRALSVQATSDYNTSPWVTEGLAVAIGSVSLFLKGSPIPSDTWHMELLDDSTEPGELGVHEDAIFDNKISGEFSTSPGPTLEPRKASAHSARALRADAPELPLMRIYCKTAKADGAAAGEVASHEMLEAAVDPQVMKTPRTVINPATQQRWIVEVGDPVQETGYTINGVEVANFALPEEFGLPAKLASELASGKRVGAHGVYDFRGVLPAPFSISRGGYMSVAPVDEESWTQITGPLPA